MKIRNFSIASMLASISSLFLFFSSYPTWFEYTYMDESNTEIGWASLVYFDDSTILPFFVMSILLVGLIGIGSGTFYCLNWKSVRRIPFKLLLFQLVPSLIIIITCIISWAFIEGFAHGHEPLEGICIVLFLMVLVSFILVSSLGIILQVAAYRYRKNAYSRPERTMKKATLLVISAVCTLSTFVPIVTYYLVQTEAERDPTGSIFVIIAALMNVATFVLLCFTNTYASTIREAQHSIDIGLTEKGVRYFQKAGLSDVAGYHLRTIGENELAARCYEKEYGWQDARTCRSRLFHGNVLEITKGPIEVDLHGVLKNKTALIVGGIYSVLSIVLVGMIFMPGWLTADLDETYSSEWEEVDRIEFEFQMEEGLYRSSGHYSAHAYDKDGNEYFYDGDRTPYTRKGYVFTDPYDEWDLKGAYNYEYEAWFYTLLVFSILFPILFIGTGTLVAFGRTNGRFAFIMNLFVVVIFIIFLIALVTRHGDGPTYLRPDGADPVMAQDMRSAMAFGPQVFMTILLLLGMIACSVVMVRYGNYRKRLYLARGHTFSLDLKKAGKYYRSIGMKGTADYISRLSGWSRAGPVEALEL